MVMIDSRLSERDAAYIRPGLLTAVCIATYDTSPNKMTIYVW